MVKHSYVNTLFTVVIFKLITKLQGKSITESSEKAGLISMSLSSLATRLYSVFTLLYINACTYTT